MSYDKEACRKYYKLNRERIKQRHHAYWANNKEKYRQYHREKNLELKVMVLTHYSGGESPSC